jgi:hypothetical protein
MPLVFVHGVANRKSPEYDKLVDLRNGMFQSTVLKYYLANEHAAVFNPMWGDLVPVFPEQNLIIPPPDMSGGRFTAFGARQLSEIALPAFYFGSRVPQGERLLALARQSFTSFVDQLWQAAALSPQVEGDPHREAEMAEAGLALAGYAVENPSPAWLKTVADDLELLEELAKALEKWRKGPRPAPPTPTPAGVPAQPGLLAPGTTVQPPAFQAFGVADKVMGWLRGAATGLQQAAVDIPNDYLLEQFRPGLTKGLVLFFGDVFSYLANRGTVDNPGTIPTKILEDLLLARAEADKRREKLVVISHSMGGNIMYDLLTYFKPDLQVDDFVTIGCQASVFKQLALFKGQELKVLPGGFAQPKAPRPANVKRWLNIFDPQDILSFAFEPEFDGVSDYYFESPGSTLTAHGDYFKRIRFYERLLVRLKAP